MLPDWDPDRHDNLGIHSHMIDLVDTVFELQQKGFLHKKVGVEGLG